LPARGECALSARIEPSPDLSDVATRAKSEGRRAEPLEPSIIFLQNHGLIVSAENYETVISLTEDVLEKLEQRSGCCMDEYKLTTKLAQLFDYKYVAYLSQDSYFKKILRESPEYFHAARFFPDAVVYCGLSCLFIHDLTDKTSIWEYQKNHADIPKIIIFEENIFFIAKNLSKAREIEEVFKANLNILSIAAKIDGNIEFFSQEECLYLSSWESEKYRKNI
jgi:rhamnose utilization protein RhaD (predicted bifunctional aldolase and dehydrogenase)